MRGASPNSRALFECGIDLITDDMNVLWKEMKSFPLQKGKYVVLEQQRSSRLQVKRSSRLQLRGNPRTYFEVHWSNAFAPSTVRSSLSRNLDSWGMDIGPTGARNSLLLFSPYPAHALMNHTSSDILIIKVHKLLFRSHASSHPQMPLYDHQAYAKTSPYSILLNHACHAESIV
jgi:hypothetical protein